MAANLIELAAQYQRAADHTATYGIVQKRHYLSDHRSNGTPVGERPVDTVGAVSWALTGTPEPPLPADNNVEFEDAIRFVAGHIPGQAPTHVVTGRPEYIEHIAKWHDEPGRTAEQVIALLRLCAREAIECDELSRRIAEHGDWADWCEQSRDEYVALHSEQDGAA